MENPFVIDPNGVNEKQVRQMANDVVELLVTHFSSLRSKKVWKKHSINDFHSSSPLNWEQTLVEMKYILEHSMQVSHPRFFGHMDSGALYVSILADWITSALNQNMLAWELSPLASMIEDEVINWLCNLCGYQFGEGSLVSGGTMANLTGLLLALQRSTKGRFRQDGIWAFNQKPVVFTSEQAHYSISKACVSTGLGENSVMKIGTDENFRINVQQLEKAIRNSISNNYCPIMVVATAGTTSTGSVDPLKEIAGLCRKYNLWFHVDSAHGAGALVSDKTRKKLDGIELADSITLDPHKWLMQPKGMGVILTKHKGMLQQLFNSSAPYLSRKQEAQPISRGSMTLQGSRRFDALRLWITRRYIGDVLLSDLVNHSFEQITQWVNLLKCSHTFELAHNPDLNLLCFRYRPIHVHEDHLNELNEWIQQELMKSGDGFVSLTTLNGQRWLRSVFINPTTTVEDMKAVIEAIKKLGENWDNKNKRFYKE